MIGSIKLFPLVTTIDSESTASDFVTAVASLIFGVIDFGIDSTVGPTLCSELTRVDEFTGAAETWFGAVLLCCAAQYGDDLGW